LIELLVTVAVIGILAGLLLGALSRAKTQARTLECMSNLRQLQVAWTVYASDNLGRLPNNNRSYQAGLVASPPCWTGGWMRYVQPGMEFVASQLTNEALMLAPGTSRLGPYVRSARVFKCPADRQLVDAAGGAMVSRVRTCALNAFMGAVGETRRTDLTYYDLADLVKPGPSDLYVFVDEHEDTLDAPAFEVTGNARPPQWSLPDLPSLRHGRATPFSFADGHLERHRWTDERTQVPVSGVYRVGDASPFNPDVAWLLTHALKYDEMLRGPSP
jgi:prepilin-type processing-associated H-X9-DG protein